MSVRLLLLFGISLQMAMGVIPAVTSETPREGSFVLKPDAYVYVPTGLERLYIGTLNAAGAKCRMAPADVSCAIQFLSADMVTGGLAAPSGEGYAIRVTPEVINLYAASDAGRFYGLQTLAQWIEASPRGADGSIAIACRDVADRPRFAWRGYMLDESRHFTGVEELKRQIDAMARYKINRLHWHLTDSPGWRIEIKKYPELTRIGGKGLETDQSPGAKAFFYTQEQVKDIVTYAKERQIVVVPEIDMPGHADAAVRAYPEHDGGGFLQKNSKDKWPRFTFNPAKPATLAFLDDILGEVAALFPDAGVIHFGGDEVHFGWQKWPELPEVRELMQKESIKDLAGVESWFSRRMAGRIHQLGFRTGGWDEIAARGLPAEQTVVFWWRHDKPAILKQALADGYPVVLCPRRPCYFDFVQHDSHKTGRRWGGFNPLRDVYQFPDALGLSPVEEAKVLGMQGCLWTEVAVTQEQRNFLTWPRLIALAEAGWTRGPVKDFASFEQRLKPELKWLESHGISHYNPFTNNPEPGAKTSKDDYLDRPE